MEDKGKYDGEMARTFSHQIIVDIRNGAYQKQKAAGHDKGDEKGEEQAEAGEEEAWGGVEDGKVALLSYCRMRLLLEQTFWKTRATSRRG